jgi:hypothetical protein
MWRLVWPGKKEKSSGKRAYGKLPETPASFYAVKLSLLTLVPGYFLFMVSSGARESLNGNSVQIGDRPAAVTGDGNRTIVTGFLAGKTRPVGRTGSQKTDLDGIGDGCEDGAVPG